MWVKLVKYVAWCQTRQIQKHMHTDREKGKSAFRYRIKSVKTGINKQWNTPLSFDADKTEEILASIKQTVCRFTGTKNPKNNNTNNNNSSIGELSYVMSLLHLYGFVANHAVVRILTDVQTWWWRIKWAHTHSHAKKKQPNESM